jgi:aminodeoxyfutalosine synthase
MCRYTAEQFHPEITEVHITGSAHPHRDLLFYLHLIESLRTVLPPQVAIKAFSAIEIINMCRIAGQSVHEGITMLKEKGLNIIAGGGAEIFDSTVRAQICPDKPDAEAWLSVHRIAHQLNVPSNATMLFGHIETVDHQIDHLERIRNLQDQSGGFNAFIPLKYRAAHNNLTSFGEVDIMHTLRLFAVSRLFLDNIPHIKVYWPMLGKEAAQMALLFGADDIDGTIQKSTKIFSMAGAEEQNPSFSKEELCSMIKSAGYSPVERDSYYREIS